MREHRCCCFQGELRGSCCLFAEFVGRMIFLLSSSLMKDYFFKPPINKLSLNFLDQDLEMAYRSSYQEEVSGRARVNLYV